MPAPRKLGTFTGVFTPAIMTILGVILYLRLPAIVGQAGLWTTLGIIGLAHLISFITGLSVASVATDRKVRAGGTYYMLSRSLGLPIGGTLGLALFVGLSFGVSMYVIGFADALLRFWDVEPTLDAVRLTAATALVVVATVAVVGTTFAMRTQFAVMAAMAVSIVAIVLGSHDYAPPAPNLTARPDAQPFIVLFAIFFPAVTGFEAGVAMSGDLRDARRSLPVGTLAAIGTGFLVYALLAIFFAYTVDAAQLAGNPDVLFDIALAAPLVAAGIWTSALSSALSSVMAAPRILQATSADGITPAFFAKGHGRSGEPRRALVVSCLIALTGVAIGELDAVARISTMFFIASYGFLNLSCAIESWASPDFRPELRVPTAVSLIGAAACLIVMIEIDVLAMFGATIVLGALFLVLQRRELRLESGDAWDGFWASVARSTLHRLDRSRVHQRNWLPNVLLFGGAEGARPELVELGRQIVAARGILSNFDLVERPGAVRFSGGVEAKIDAEGAPYGIFARRVECADVYEGMEMLARFYGFAGVQPNAVLLGWARHSPEPARFAALVDTLADLDFNVLLFSRHDGRGREDAPAGAGAAAAPRIDIWWRGGGRDALLALALVRYLTASDPWRTADVRFLVAPDDDDDGPEPVRREAARRVDEARVRASIKTIGQVGRRAFGGVVRTESHDAALTVIAMPPIEGVDPTAYVERTNALIEGLGPVLLVRASSFFGEAPRRRAIAPIDLPIADPDPLAALAMPADPALAAPVADLDERMQAAARRVAADCLSPSYGPHVALVTRIAADVGMVARELEHAQEIDGPRAIRRVRKAQGDLLFRVRRTLEDYRARDVPAQAAALSDGVASLLDAFDALPAALPAHVDLAGPAAADPAPVERPRGRLVEIGQRMIDTVTGGTTRRVRLAAIAREALAPAAAEILEHLLRTFGADAYQAVLDTQRQIDAARAALDRVDAAVQAGADLPDAVRAEIGPIVRDEVRLVETHRAACTRAISALHRRTRDATVAVAASAAGAARPGRGADRQAIDALREWPRAWADAQALVVNAADIDAHLLALRHRIDVIVQRARQSLRLEIQNGLLARLDELRGALAAFLAQVARDTDAELPRRFEAWPAFDPNAVVAGLLEELHAATDALPVQVDTIGPSSAVPLETGRVDLVEPVTVSLRRLAEYRIEAELVGPLQELLARVPAAFERTIDVARDAVRLTTLRPSRFEADEAVDRAAVVRGGLDRLGDAVAEIERLAADLDRGLTDRLRATLDLLSSYGVMRAEGDAERYRRAAVSREALSRFGAQWRRLQQASVDAAVALLHGRSAAVLITRELEARASRGGLDDLRQLVQAVSPRPEVLAALPFHYRQLFLGGVSFTRDAWFGWDEEERKAAAAVGDHRRGLPGGLLILGDEGAGKSSLLQHLAARHVPADRRFTLPAPGGGAPDEADLRRRLCVMSGVAPGMADPLAALPTGSAVLIDDLDAWWERSSAGLSVLQAIVDLMSRHGGRLLFIATADRHAFRLIDSLERVATHFISVIECRPLDGRHLADAILFRHGSAGLTFSLDGVPESSLSALQRARLFSRFFDYTRGTIGAALHAWIAHIRRVSGDAIEIAHPTSPDLTALDRISSVQTALLVQLLLHRGLEPERLARLSGGMPAPALRREIDALRRAGVLRERSNGAFAVDVFLRPHLAHAFVEKGVLPA